MEADIFFSEPRWKILEILTTVPSSPLEISKKLNTSVAYISQQLKLLEAAKFIFKTKTGKSDKGQARNLYEISKEFVFITSLIRGHPAKKLVYLSSHHKTILKIWLLENAESHYFIEKLYWKLESDLKDIKSILVEKSKNSGKIQVIIISDSKTLKLKISSYLKDLNNQIECTVIGSDNKKSSKIDFISIYDQESLTNQKLSEGGYI